MIAFRPLLFPEILSSTGHRLRSGFGGFYIALKNINRASVTVAWECLAGVQEKTSY